jgi:mono/diheme cytochrome c family protein
MQFSAHYTRILHCTLNLASRVPQLLGHPFKKEARRVFKSLLIVSAVLLLALAACSGGGQSAPAGTTPSPGDAGNGKKLFASATIGKNNAPGCTSCHAVGGQGGQVGPDLSHVATDAATIVKSPDYKGKAQDAPAYLRESIVDPNAYVVKGYSAGIMYENFGKDLSSQDISDLVAYLMTLK